MKDGDIMKFARMKDLREDRDLSQSDIAKIIYTSQTQYSRWERGANDPPINILIRLADYYNVSLDYITGRTNAKTILTRVPATHQKTDPPTRTNKGNTEK